VTSSVVAESFSSALGRPISLVTVSVEAYVASLLQGGVEPWFANAIGELDNVVAQGLAKARQDVLWVFF
jgi:hypothetical protein